MRSLDTREREPRVAEIGAPEPAKRLPSAAARSLQDKILLHFARGVERA
jgi:hypothetical protein